MRRLKFLTITASLFLIAGTIKNNDTQKIMDSVFASMNTLLPLSLKLEDFSNPKNQPQIDQAIKNLKRSSHDLSKHVIASSANNRIASLNLTIDIEELNELYSEKQYERARFLLHSLTENCVNCHTRLHPDKQKKGLEIHFSQNNKKMLTGLDLAHFEVMGRKFDSAMDLYEKEFRRDPKLIDSQSFFEYLKVAVRVKMSLARIEKLLTDIQPKLDPKMEISQMAKKWLASVKDMQNMNIDKNLNIKTAEKLLEKAKVIKSYPKDESGILYLMAASYVLHTILDTGKPNADQLAEVYYYLGVSEGFISVSCWLQEYDFYFEQSIRANPRSPWATKSLTALREAMEFDYSGSSGENIPGDEQMRMQELKNLINESKTKNIKKT